jgi:hypothetical protein
MLLSARASTRCGLSKLASNLPANIAQHEHHRQRQLLHHAVTYPRALLRVGQQVVGQEVGGELAEVSTHAALRCLGDLLPIQQDERMRILRGRGAVDVRRGGRGVGGGEERERGEGRGERGEEGQRRLRRGPCAPVCQAP